MTRRRGGGSIYSRPEVLTFHQATQARALLYNDDGVSGEFIATARFPAESGAADAAGAAGGMAADTRQGGGCVSGLDFGGAGLVEME